MSASEPTTRYLYLRGPDRLKLGLGHLRCDWVQNLARCADLLGRVPVIAPLPLDPRHNLGHAAPGDPLAYFDLDNLKIRPSPGAPPVPLACELTERLPLESFPASEVHTLRVPVRDDATVALAPEHDRHRVLVLDFSEGLEWHRVLSSEGPIHRKRDPSPVVIPPAKDLVARAAKLAEELAGGGDYLCVKVRRGDAMGPVFAGVRQHLRLALLTSPRNVAANMRRFPPDLPTYLMTNERDDRFYDRLLRDRPQLKRYSDYPDLRELRQPPEGAPPNNYRLYMIEELLLWGAKFKLGHNPDYVGMRQHLHRGLPLDLRNVGRGVSGREWRRALIPHSARERALNLRRRLRGGAA